MRKFILISVLCLMLSPAAATAQGPEGWTQVEVWRRQLKKGMTDEEALKIFGEPKDKEFGRRAMVWYYQECPERIDAKVVSRPTRGFVKFNQTRAFYRSRQPIYQVYDWREPGWELVKETLALELQKAAEIEAAEAAKAEAERLKAEEARKAAELKEAELKKQELAKTAQAGGQQPASKASTRASKWKLPGLNSKNLTIAGAGLGAVVLLWILLFARPWV